MISWFIARKLDTFEAHYDYDATTMRELLGLGLSVLSPFHKATALANFRRGVSAAAWRLWTATSASKPASLRASAGAPVRGQARGPAALHQSQVSSGLRMRASTTLAGSISIPTHSAATSTRCAPRPQPTSKTRRASSRTGVSQRAARVRWPRRKATVAAPIWRCLSSGGR